MGVSQMMKSMEAYEFEEGAIAYFVLGVMPYAIVNAYSFSSTAITNQEAFIISSLVGCVLFFTINSVTKRCYNFSYEPTLKTFFILTLQALVAALPAAAIIILFTTQGMAISMLLSIALTFAGLGAI